MDELYTATKLRGKNGSWGRRWLSRLVKQSGVLLIIAVWAGWVGVWDVSPLVIPGPQAVFGDIVLNPSAYAADTLWTVSIALLGLILGIVLALFLAVIVWWSPVFKSMVTPPVLILRTVPMVAMIPVFARIVGYNIWTILVVATLVAYFPAFILCVSGLSSASRGRVDLFRVLGASKRTVMSLLALPSTIPNLLIAVRISAVTCVVGALLAEFVIGRRGLGHLFLITRLEYNVARQWGAAIVATAVSLLFFLGASALERWGRARVT